jgi:alpha-ribazole phosphatase
MKLWLIRHAAVNVAPGICYGQTDVTPDPDALQTAAHRLATEIPQATIMWHSPLQRCEQLSMEIRRERADLTSKIDFRLLEMHFGPWEMQSWKDIGKPAMDDWLSDFLHRRPGGEPSGASRAESVGELLERVAQALKDSAALAQKQHPIAWVTHAGVIRAALALARGQPILEAADWPQDDIPMGSAIQIEL